MHHVNGVIENAAYSDCGCAGVFAYEVAEEFGIHYGAALLRGETIDAKALAENLADAMERSQ